MSDGHGDADGGGGGGYAVGAPVAGNAEAAYIAPASAADGLVLRGIEINRAPVRETAKEYRVGWREGA
jgi:hypothetical protein